MKLKGMDKMKNSKIILIAISLLIIATFVGCSNISGGIRPKKLELTKENIQKVFSEKYKVGVYSIDNESNKPISISVNFGSKNYVPKNKAKEELAQVESTLHKNFTISNLNIIDIELKGQHTLIKDNYGKIQIGDIPQINIQEPTFYIPQAYPMYTKLNILTLNRDNIKITATDYEDGDLTNKIKLRNSNVLTKIGKQTLIYEVTDKDGNTVANNDLTIEITK